MTFGLRLTGTPIDLTTLHALASSAPSLLDAPWQTIATEGAAAYAIASRAMSAELARELAARGLDAVSVTHTAGSSALAPLREGAACTVLVGARRRHAATLLEAVKPVLVAGEPVVDDACFVIAPGSPSAHATLERLLRLGRDDAQVAECATTTGARRLIVRVARPPMYLLLRAREEPGEGVRAYARATADLWVAWGWAHPLAGAAQAALAAAGRVALVDADGAWQLASAPWPLRSIYDVIAPTLDAARVDLAAAEGQSRFEMRLHLGAAPDAIAELWLLSPERFASLEPLVEGATPDELSRLTVARCGDAAGHATYVVRELIRPNAPRLGTRVSDLLGVRGFVRAAGTDNLYVPTARRLLPAMRRDALRTLLGLDGAHHVVVDEDADGPRVVAIRSADEVPLSRWVEYVATDRRVELDRLLERTVFELPELAVQPRPAAARGGSSGAKRASGAEPRPPRPARAEREKPATVPTRGAEPVRRSAQDVADRAEIARLERVVAEGGCDAAATWRELGALKLRVGQGEEACACLEAAVFHGDRGAAASLAHERARRVTEPLDALARRPLLAPAEAAYLGAAVLDAIERRDPAVDALAPLAAARFADPATPVSRRLAWSVLSACYARTNDRLGITRAKEAVLGAVNDRGLSETQDLPTFVRLALAVDAATEAAPRAPGDPLAALEPLWWNHAQPFVQAAGDDATDEAHVLACYVRLAFAVGFARAGAASLARELLALVEEEAAAHKAPNQVLFKLYAARTAFVATRGAAAAWEAEVAAALAAVTDPRVRDRVEWLRRRSEWLRTSVPEAPPPRLGAAIESLLATAEGSADPQQVPRALGEVLALRRRAYDYELDVAIERSLAGALKRGSDEAIAATLAVAMTGLPMMSILGHRARALGACLRAAATLGDAPNVDKLIDEIVAVVQSPDAPAVQDLLHAVGPALAALRRLGIGTAAARLLEALSQIPRANDRERIALRASLADGYLQLRDEARALALLDEAVAGTLDPALDYVGRFEGGAATLAALRHWPTGVRVVRCARLLDELDVFRDTFTANQFYATHKVLLLEKLVDTLTDETTFRADRVQRYLDADERAIRRRILADWRDVCGR